jgi:4-amino-4-deoxy-L-arabinose transferase-like glycosyltransferase
MAGNGEFIRGLFMVSLEFNLNSILKKNFTKLRQSGLFDYLILLAFSVGLVIFVFTFYSPKLSHTDEIIYAVVGRNIANGKGIISNYYHPLSVIAEGHPLADVHVPGYAFFLAGSFLVLGENEYATFFPNHVSYVVVGLLLYWAGRQLANRWAGFYSALLFYLFPSVISYTHTAMSELTLTLLSVVYFVLWLKTLLAPKWPYSIILAVVLAGGMLHHETFVVFLPSALYLLWQWPANERRKASLSFGAVFIILVVFVFWPAYQSRPPYPLFVSSLFAQPDWQSVLQGMVDNVLTSITTVIQFENLTWQLAIRMQYLLIIILIVLYSRFDSLQKKVAIYTIFSFVGNYAGLVLFYPLTGWQGERVFIHLIPPALILLSVPISKIRLTGLKVSVAAVVLGLCLLASVWNVSALMKKHRGERKRVEVYNEVITRYTDEIKPETVLVDDGFLYGWTHYPAIVIAWGTNIDAEVAEVLVQKITIDAIIIKERFRKEDIDQALELRGFLFSQGYYLSGVDEGFWIFTKQPLE